MRQPQELREHLVDSAIDAIVVGSTSGANDALDPVFELAGREIPVLVAVPAGGPEPPSDPRVFYVLRPTLPAARTRSSFGRHHWSPWRRSHWPPWLFRLGRRWSASIHRSGCSISSSCLARSSLR